MTFENLRRELVKRIEAGNATKSSHWKAHTKDFSFTNDYRIRGINGFSNRTRRFPGSRFLHTRNLVKLYPEAKELLQGVDFKNVSDICKSQGREIDSCVARNFFTINLLREKKIDFRNSICVIGDGQANFVTLALYFKISKKVISINLNEVLLSDLDLIETSTLIDSSEIQIATSKSEVDSFFQDPLKRLLLISSEDLNLLSNLEIDLFVNIASFQEMTVQQIEQYFEMIKSNRAYLYACNRTYKKLYGGEITEFFKYPWGDSTTILDEKCNWHQAFYSLKSIRLYKKLPFDGEIWHRLIKF